jgi:hypothetical protein
MTWDQHVAFPLLVNCRIQFLLLDEASQQMAVLSLNELNHCPTTDVLHDMNADRSVFHTWPLCRM